MISYEDCLNYIENIMPDYWASTMVWKDWQVPSMIKLSDSQKHLLKNLIEGKITDCPRNMGKTFVIQLYADYLNYVTDMCKYDSGIGIDETISCDETIKFGLLNEDIVRRAVAINKEKAMIEYCISENEIEKYL